jgi:hypothetical protein
MFMTGNPVSNGPADCGEMDVWDVGMGMCMPLPMAGMPMSMVMVHGNAFGAYVSTGGSRGREAVYSPNMFMADAGRSLGDRHYLNLDLMLTSELWTVPAAGYPLLMQIGENQANGQPFLDAQHPHSSPIMGLTLSDTIKLDTGEKDNLKLFFAPRGESTDGPIAFMHRPTGMMNPDAPLGHHIGQDVGHITSTVIGGSLKLGNTRIEASTFHGTEPEPTKVDLPIGTPNSGAVRLIEEFSPDFMAMASFAYVKSPEPNDPDVPFVLRFSGSVYYRVSISENWKFYNALIYGGITKYDHASLLNSVGEEFWFEGGAPNIWGRIEAVQRTPDELQIPGASDRDSGRWVEALTLGYTHNFLRLSGLQVGVGGSVTKNFLPDDYRPSYGGDPWSGKVFLQVSGMGMWHWH